MSQVSPRAACRAWVTTQLMQPPGLWDTRAASVSVSSALQTASGSSSGSAKMKILEGSRGGKGEMQIHITHGRAGRSSSHFHCCCSIFPLLLSIFPFSTLSLPRGSSLHPKIIWAQEECALPMQRLVDVTQLCPHRGLCPGCLFQPGLIPSVGKGWVSPGDNKIEAPTPPEGQHSPLLVGEGGAGQAVLGNHHPLVQGSWEGHKQGQ